MSDRNRATDKKDQGIGLVDTAPIELNKDSQSWNLSGVKSGVAASRFDQTYNKGTVEGVAGRTSNISRIASK